MNALLPGFAAAADAQSCFRAVLEAVSRPGRIMSVSAKFTPPEGLCLAAAAALLTLADATTGVSLPESLATAQDWLIFHTGTRQSPMGKADFVLAMQRPKLASLRQGTESEPETSATLILQLPAFETGRRIRLSGPGIATTTELDLPLDDAFIPEWQAQRRRNPCGIDVLLCAANRVLAFPRSVSLEAI